MGVHHSSVVAAPLADVFAWHERPGAIHRLLPPWQPVRVACEAHSLRDGRAVLRLPAGVSWTAQHGEYDPPHRFVDELVSLPLPWRHVHTFEAVTPSSTRVTDDVETPIPGGLLTQMFRYRHRQLADDLVSQRVLSRLHPRPLTVALTGSSGLVGSALRAFLTTGGHRVLRLVRHTPRADDERAWVPDAPDPASLADVDAVVHLAGASIAGRFTPAHKQAVRDSRVGPTRRLAESMASRRSGPRVLVAASAIGYYGADRGDEVLREDNDSGGGFLASVVAEWEAAARPAREAGIRVVHVRIGIVQSARGATLRVFRPLFGAGLGGRLGDGRQWVSWIDIDDLVDVLGRAIVDPGLSGPVNAVAPNPVRNGEYAATLARVLRRPALVPVPSFGSRLLLGDEGAHELAAASQRVEPARLLSAGHAFRFPTLIGCLRHQLGRAEPDERP